ncbi:MAG TPA: 16S rRNA (cytosine(1402)-N(4))-methyltransferase RsmH, partial [Longimicrobiales bacterium]|nr:16S rRNA (cytosine(1402)-N(4))-methyltransferase RsmH [Longimicrobiales bacterium]
MSAFHEPVLGEEAVRLLDPRGEGLYLDGTVGGGGHSRRILERCSGCRVLAVDRDVEALERARVELAEFGSRVRYLHARFDEAPSDPEARASGLDGALLDLGVSAHQLREPARGFSFARGVALDMRMDATTAMDASRFLSEASEERLAQVFRDFGEEPRARRLAREIVKRRRGSPAWTSDELVA